MAPGISRRPVGVRRITDEGVPEERSSPEHLLRLAEVFRGLPATVRRSPVLSVPGDGEALDGTQGAENDGKIFPSSFPTVFSYFLLYCTEDSLPRTEASAEEGQAHRWA